MDANRKPGDYQLKSELARFCLPAASRDSNRKLAWTNSICILFLLIGLVGAQPASLSNKPLPTIEEVIPTILEPIAPPPPATTEDPKQNQDEQDKPDTPQVVVVTPESPAVNFSIPTIGNLVVPNAVAKAPPLAPLRSIAPVKSQPATLDNTGFGGDRPIPPYPKIAKEQAQQGTVRLLLKVNESGTIADIQVSESSGYPLLDRSTLEFVKRHWIVQPGTGSRSFEATIKYQLTN
jgi:TonB family protein